MEKAIDGMERIRNSLNDGSLVFNQKTAAKYDAVDKQMKGAISFATTEDRAVLDGLDAIAKKNEAILKQHGTIAEGGDYIAKSNLGDTTSQAFQKAKVEFIETQNKVAAFCRGEKIEGIEHTASGALQKAHTEAEHAAHKLIGKASGQLGIARTVENGWSKAFKKNVSEMNGFKSGLAPMERAKAFGKGSVVVAGAAALVDGVFRGKDSQGEDRSTAFRVMEAVVGGGVGAWALTHGRAIMR